MTGEGVLAIIAFLGVEIAGVFSMLDSVMFGDTTFTILDVFIAILFLELIIGYIMRVITTRSSGFGVDEESTGANIEDADAYDATAGGRIEPHFPTR